MNKLREATDYQIQAMKYLAETANGFLYMEMRLGKTLPTIRHIRNKLPAIILCPAPAHGSWAEELVLEGVDASDVAIWGPTKKARKAAFEAKYLIATYQSAKIHDLLRLRPWKVRVYDESYILAKPSSGVSSYVREAWAEGVQHIALSGNPAAETKMDYVNQFLCVRGRFGIYRTPWDFYLEHTIRDNFGAFQYKVAGFERKIVEYVKRKAFVLTRKDAGVGGLKLPVWRYCDLPASQKKRYLELLQGDATKYVSRETGKEKEYNPLVKCLHLAQMCSGINPETGKLEGFEKIRAAKELLNSELAGKQVILFSRFKSEIRAMAGALKCPYIDGDTPRPEQATIRQAFQAGAHKYAVLSVDTCKMGLNFSAAKAAIYLSNSLAGDVRAQSEDRVIHLTDTEDRIIVDLCCRNGVDEYISRLVKDKTISSKSDLAQRAIAQARK